MEEQQRDHHRFFALGYSLFGRFSEPVLGKHRARLLDGASGRVIEIGAGTGLNFRYYPAAAAMSVVATEPDRHMLRRVRRTAALASVGIEVTDAAAESLPFADASFDTAVTTLVLCSVDDQAASLAEIRRVLRPGGTLLFFEHVRASDPALAAKQDRRQPLWSRLAGGCHPNRNTEDAIEAAGFAVEEIDRFGVRGSKLVRPHILGRAKNPG